MEAIKRKLGRCPLCYHGFFVSKGHSCRKTFIREKNNLIEELENKKPLLWDWEEYKRTHRFSKGYIRCVTCKSIVTSRKNKYFCSMACRTRRHGDNLEQED